VLRRQATDIAYARGHAASNGTIARNENWTAVNWKPGAMLSSPVRYDRSVEFIAEDEADTIRQLEETLRHISEVTFADSGHASRSVHAKSHGIVKAQLEVGALPSSLAQGLFARPATYPVVMRFSTIPGDVLDDEITVPRAVAIKIIGVQGERLPGSENDVTQDFVLADGPAFAAPTAKKFLSSLKLLATTTDKAPGLKKVLSTVLRGVEGAIEGVGGKSTLLTTLGGHPDSNILGATFYSQAPIRFGDYIAKISLTPASAKLVALRDAPVNSAGRPNALRDAVRLFFATTTGVWDLCAQLCTDLETMPVEDASVPWPEEQSPYAVIGRITAKPQDAWSDANIRSVDEGMAFSPWHGLAAHRPLGSVMRARRVPYQKSAQFRAEHNGCPIHEPGPGAGR
jgi:hypothetical protein